MLQDLHGNIWNTDPHLHQDEGIPRQVFFLFYYMNSLLIEWFQKLRFSSEKQQPLVYGGIFFSLYNTELVLSLVLLSKWIVGVCSGQ